jgi:hypothetical protein
MGPPTAENEFSQFHSDHRASKTGTDGSAIQFMRVSRLCSLFRGISYSSGKRAVLITIFS